MKATIIGTDGIAKGTTRVLLINTLMKRVCLRDVHKAKSTMDDLKMC